MANLWAAVKDRSGLDLTYFDMLWHCSQLSYTDDNAYSNQQIAKCKHIEKIFADTRVADKEPEFFMDACKRTKDAVGNHPVLFIGKWRQGKSSLVNSCIEEAMPDQRRGARAATGRRSRVTNNVTLFGPIEDEQVGNIWLADTPGLEPDQAHDIMGLLRKELQKKGVSQHVFTDLVILVMAGTPEGLSNLSSDHFMDWIKGTYTAARESSSLRCTVLPVVTHGDHVPTGAESQDLEYVRQKLSEVAAAPSRHRAAKRDTNADVLAPVMVTNHNWDGSGVTKRNGQNLHEVIEIIKSTVRERSISNEFRLQWSHFLTQDLEKMVQKFMSKHFHEESEGRLFYRHVEAVLATYLKKPMNLEVAFPNPAWGSLPIIERELRGETGRPSRRRFRSCRVHRANLFL